MSAKGVVHIKKRGEGEDKGVVEETYNGLQQRMGRLFEKIVDLALERQARMGSFVPRVDLVETDEQIEVSAEVPGMNEDEIEISLNPDALFIKGEKKAAREENHKGARYLERSYGSFFRRIELPQEVDTELVDAVISRGVLRLTLHKTGQTRAQKVTLRSED